MARRKPEEVVDECQQEERDTSAFAAEKSAAKAAHWRARYREAATIALDREAQIETLINLGGETTIRSFEQAKKGKSRGVAAVIPASDWHVEEQVSSDGTNGKNSFDIREAEVRINRFYTQSVRLIDWYSSIAPVVEVWHPLLGDLLTGYIHEELMETNSLSPTEACVFLQEMICSGIDHLRKETKMPIYVPTCVGNHGRTTQKKRIKTSCRNSYEWLLYKTLERYYTNDGSVKWSVGNGYHNIQTIQGRKVRFHHGDGLRYNGGVGGITIPVNKSIAQWDKATPVDFDIFGHWHTFLPGYPKWVSCGSLIGYSEFSLEIKAEFQHPTQAFIAIDRDYGMTMTLPIFLTSPKGKNALRKG
jgi:hypothetical protein